MRHSRLLTILMPDIILMDIMLEGSEFDGIETAAGSDGRRYPYRIRDCLCR